MKKLFSTVLIAVLALGVTKAQTVIYSQDFSGGIPASWSNVGTSNGSPNAAAKFRSRTNQTAGSGGQYGSSYGTIASPTVANGYISFDSDSLDEGSANVQGAGPAPAPQHVELSIPGINMTGFPRAKFQFYQDLANFQSVAAVAFSNDSLNWTIDTVDVNQTVNSATAANKQKVSIDISSILNGGNKLYVRFILDANYYFWAIDDISVITLPNTDLAVKSFGGQSLTSDGLGLFFSSFPASQNDSVTPVVVYGNIGAATQPNTVAQINLKKGGTLVPGGSYTTNPAVALLPANTDTIDFVTLATTGIGAYAASVYVHSDSTDYDLTNNSDTVKFAITDSVFSINQGALSGAYYMLRNSAALSFRYGTLFEVIHNDTVTSVTTAVLGGTGNTKPGAVIQASIYPITVGASALTYSTPVVSTYPLTLTSATISPSFSTFRTANMKIDNSSGNAVLTPGLYWAAIKGVSTPDSNIIILATEYQTNGFPIVEDFTNPGTLGYFSSTDAIFCNLNFGHEASLLYADFSRNPGVSPLRVGQPVAFTGITNGSNASTYAWTITGLSSGAIYNGTGKVYRDTFLIADSFNVCLTVTDGGSSASICKVIKVKEDGVGVQEVSPLAQTNMVPNPTTGYVTISASDITGALSISIVNMIGEEVKQYNETANGSFVKNYNLSDLSSGVYIVKLQNGANTATKRLSISK